MNLVPSSLWSNVSLERLALNLYGLDNERDGSEVRSWQVSEISASLASVLGSLNRTVGSRNPTSCAVHWLSLKLVACWLAGRPGFWVDAQSD